MSQGNNGSDQRKLSITWPFTFAGFCVTMALVYFCLGFAIRDRKPHSDDIAVEGPTQLAGHFTVFWTLLAIALVSIIAGGVFNVNRAKKRHSAI